MASGYPVEGVAACESVKCLVDRERKRFLALRSYKCEYMAKAIDVLIGVAALSVVPEK